MADEFRVSLVAELKQKSLDSAIRNAKSNVPLKINKFSINATSLAKQLQSELNKANLKVKIDGNFGKSGSFKKQVDDATNAYKRLMDMQKGMGKIQKSIFGLDAQKDAQEIARLSAALDKLKTTYGLLKSGNFGKMNISQQAAIMAEEAKAVEAAAKARDSAVAKEERTAEKAARAAEKRAAAEKKATAAVEQETQKRAKAAEKEALDIERAQKKLADVQTWMRRNPKAADAFKSELEDIIERLGTVGKEGGANLSKVSAEFAKIQSQAKLAGLTTSSFVASLKNVGLQVLGLGSVYQAVMKIISTVKNGVNTVVELDTALVDLRKTTTMSNSDLASFYRDANKEAKELGTTTQQIIQSAADWSRLGFSSKSDATMMARYAAQFAAISPGLNVDQATTGLVSVMKAYGIQTDEVLDGVMSKINRVGNTAATNNAEIIEGLQNSASALAAMNTNLDKSIALFTAGQEISQQSSKVGNALRSISLRIRGYDEETEELSEDLVNITGDVIDLTKVASNNYKGVSLFTDETQTQYKDVYDYLQDISEIWDELDAKTKQTLMEKLFGKNRANVCPHVQKCA